MWEVLLHPDVAKFLNRLDKEVRERIESKLRELRTYPFSFLEHYHGEYYKLRVGDYRALIDIDFEKHIIKVQVLDHRKNIYKQH